MAGKTKRQKCSIVLSDDVFKALRIHSALSGKDMSAIVQEALQLHIPKEAFTVAQTYGSPAAAPEAPRTARKPKQVSPAPQKPTDAKKAVKLAMDPLLKQLDAWMKTNAITRSALAETLNQNAKKPEGKALTANYTNQWWIRGKVPPAWVDAVTDYLK